MDISYMVRGSDGKEYGPASVEQLSAWAREGRVLPAHLIKRSDMDQWAAARDFTELAPCFAPAASPASSMQSAMPGAQKQPAVADARIRNCASWFFWIAGLSMINSISAFTGSAWRFIIGLSTTQIFDGLSGSLGNAGKAIALGLDVLVAGVFILFGVFARKGQMWAFLVGIILFGLDSLVFLLAQDWISVAFHAYILYRLIAGFMACREASAS